MRRDVPAFTSNDALTVPVRTGTEAAAPPSDVLSARNRFAGGALSIDRFPAVVAVVAVVIAAGVIAAVAAALASVESSDIDEPSLDDDGSVIGLRDDQVGKPLVLVFRIFRVRTYVF